MHSNNNEHLVDKCHDVSVLVAFHICHKFIFLTIEFTAKSVDLSRRAINCRFLLSILFGVVHEQLNGGI